MSWMVDSTRTDRWKEIDLELLRVREWIICTHLNIEMRNDWLFQWIESRTRSGRRSEGGGKRGKDSWREIVWGNNTKQLTGKIFIPGLCTHTQTKRAQSNHRHQFHGNILPRKCASFRINYEKCFFLNFHIWKTSFLFWKFSVQKYQYILITIISKSRARDWCSTPFAIEEYKKLPSKKKWWS